MIFGNSSPLKYLIITAKKAPAPSGRKLAPVASAKPPAKPTAPPANNQQSHDPKWLLITGIGD